MGSRTGAEWIGGFVQVFHRVKYPCDFGLLDWDNGISETLLNTGLDLKDKFPMPRTSEDILESVIYLYPDAESANRGEKAGGSGFVVRVLSDLNPDMGYLYAVTNSHVIRANNSSVVRMNTKGGGIFVGTIRDDQSHHHPDGDDIAVTPVTLPPTIQYKFLDVKDFLTKDQVEKFGIGPGDDTFMVGRLISHGGSQRNLPPVRFGNIAMMPEEPLINETRGLKQESFVVEMQSIGGFSGSPVFVQGQPWIYTDEDQNFVTRDFGPWLLGINWEHLHSFEPVLKTDSSPVDEGWQVRSNAGMAGVIPSWKVIEALNTAELQARRTIADLKMKERIASEVSPEPQDEQN